MQLLIEGSMLEQIVEVYQIERDLGDLTEPVSIIMTGCKGLNAIDTTEKYIFMGFEGSMNDSRCQF